MTPPQNVNTAPFPIELKRLVDSCTYRPGWRVRLQDIDRGQGSRGLTLIITTRTVDSYHPEEAIRVDHYFPVPPAAYDIRSWRRWLFEQFLLVERHECMEFFQIDGDRPYAPSHGPGNDPYIVRELGTEIDQRTTFRGDLNPPKPSDTKVKSQPVRIFPTTSKTPLTERQQRQWDQALKVACPECRAPVDRRCINMAPSHAKAARFYETKLPHPARLNVTR